MTHQPENEQKPNKKGFRHHARKVHGRFTKYLIERDTIFATLWVFIFIVVLALIPLNLGIMNPIKLGLKDFDFNDMYYSHVGNNQKKEVDNNIVVINIGRADREDIAMMIDKVATFSPKVMGLDVLFEGPRDPHKDSILDESIRRNKNLVLATKYQTDSGGKLIAGNNYFKNNSTLTGYVNFPYNSDMESIRTYIPFKKDEKNHDLILPSFTSTLIKIFDSASYHNIEEMADHKIIINYTRKVTDKKKQYQIIEPENLMMDQVDSAAIRGKIALFAYTNIDPNDIEDKKFTPMNEKYAGKTTPDMNGILVHANILSMILEKNFIKKVPLWGNLLLAIVVCWIHMSFFIHYYLESHIWFHLAAKIAQVFSALFFVWLGIEIFSRYGLKVDMKMSLIVIVLAVDVIYFYEAWAVWMHKKFNFRTIFKPHHH
jgi:CHASE2 domain-containing sensor protein